MCFSQEWKTLCPHFSPEQGRSNPTPWQRCKIQVPGDGERARRQEVKPRRVRTCQALAPGTGWWRGSSASQQPEPAAEGAEEWPSTSQQLYGEETAAGRGGNGQGGLREPRSTMHRLHPARIQLNNRKKL